MYVELGEGDFYVNILQVCNFYAFMFSLLRMKGLKPVHGLDTVRKAFCSSSSSLDAFDHVLESFFRLCSTKLNTDPFMFAAFHLNQIQVNKT